jgi:hypothetical protein
MTRNPNNLEFEKLRMQKEGLKEQKSEESFLGIPWSSSKDDEDEQSKSFSIGFGMQSSKDSSQNFFSDQNDNITQFSIGDTKLDSLNPAVKSMIHQLELFIKSGKVDQQAIEIYQQISQIIPVSLISNYSTIIDTPSLEKIKQLSNFSTNNEQSNQHFIDPIDNHKSTELSKKDKDILAEFYGEIRQNSKDAIDSLENNLQINRGQNFKNNS